MALSNACTIFGRHVFYRNAIKTFDNLRRATILLSSKYSTVTKIDDKTVQSIFGEVEEPTKKKISKAMKAYLQRAKEHDEFLQNEKQQYQIGKRHLANMMGVDADTFTQEDIDSAIQYLFPSGLYDKRARPIMAEPDKIFPPRKAAEFDESGRPFHSMFYTMKPNYYDTLYNMIEEMEKLNKFEDGEMSKGLLPNSANKLNLLGSDWKTLTELETIFLEKITDKDYDAFIAAGDRLADHPYSENCKDFIMRFRNIKKMQTLKLITIPLQYDDQGRPFIHINNCFQKDARGSVKLWGNGSGKITINGENINYFKRLQYREQVIFPLIFTGMDDKIDVEATVESGGPTGQAGAIRWGIAWGLRSFVDTEMIEKMRIAGLLTRDWRSRERKKPGQEGARRKFTWKKR